MDLKLTSFLQRVIQVIRREFLCGPTNQSMQSMQIEKCTHVGVGTGRVFFSQGPVCHGRAESLSMMVTVFFIDTT